MNALPMAIGTTLAALPFAILAGYLIRRWIRQRAYRHIAMLGEQIVTARAHPEKNAAVWVEKAEEFRLRAKQEFDEGNNYFTGLHYLRSSENALRSAAGVPTTMNRADRRAARKRGGKVTAAHVFDGNGDVQVVRQQTSHQRGGKRRKRR